MIDLSKIKYRVVAIAENGTQYNIKSYIENVGFEEGEKEISVRSSFTIVNENTPYGRLSSLIKPGVMIGIFATDDSSLNEEVARGFAETWNPVEQNGEQVLKVTCYDELYKLQKSQDNRFYGSGTGTKTIITGIFNDWKIPYESYSGPNVSHGKQVFNNRALSDIILETLDDAEKKGAGKYLLRTTKGYTDVIERGSNKAVYVFRKDNSKQFSESISTAELVTRVTIVGQADDDGKTKVEATLNGMTKFGVRQKVYTRGSDDTLAAAKTAAQEILDKDGSPEKTMVVQAPDVPFIHKGDLVYIISSLQSGYYFVNSVRHDCDTYSMTMDLEIAKPKSEKAKKKDYNVGDIVDFKGGTHYVTSYSDSAGYSASAGKAKITIKNGSGKAHPWHLIHVDSGSNVYGWVDDGTFS